MPSKSVRGDGTAKKRWSSAERAARGHNPRRRGGQPRSRTEDRPARRPEAPLARAPKSATEQRDFRPARKPHTRPDRAEWPSRSARDNSKRGYTKSAPDSGDSRTTREPRFRDERPGRAERPARAPRHERPERDQQVRFERRDLPKRSDRRDQPQRDDRRVQPQRFERSDRPERIERRDRPEKVQRDRPERIERLSAPPVVREQTGDFAGLGLPPSLVAALRAEGITNPFPIQAAAIPDALAGRDVLGRGQTGSGKTLAFGLPMITTLAGAASSLPRAIVLVPTRELAMQVHDVLSPLAKTADLSVVLVAGGMSYTPQLRAFQRGVDIVVATPGRLIDLMDQGAVDLSRVEIAVLDEADHMADLGFMPDVTTILDSVPPGGQRLLFSATLDGAVDRLVRTYLDHPVTHQVDSAQASVSTMAHHLLHIAPKDKAQVTAEIAGRPGRTLIFVRTQRGADRVAEQLRAAGVLAGALHGGLAQGARTRILSVFKDGTLPVLVATDVAARGIHVDEVGLVLQVDPPGGPKEYLHRAGRTARAGGTGMVLTLVLPHQRRELSRLAGQAGVRPIELPALPGDRTLAEATGARVTDTGAVSEGDYERLIAPPPARRRHAADRPHGKSGGYGRSRHREDGRSSQRSPRRDRDR